MDIKQSVTAYESWLRGQLAGEVVDNDLAVKHARMREGPFPFLRATYWRWSEEIVTLCNELGSPSITAAPSVLAIGDIHLENYGTWRDVEGRLVWGVNDFDEAADMPYVLDLVRLATSATLAAAENISLERICAAVCDGYQAGLRAPKPFVLDAEHRWLRQKLEVPERRRARYWEKNDPDQQKLERPNPIFVRAIRAVLPDPTIKMVYWRRSAGTGSLGRPRWVGFGTWRGAPLIREAKSILTSGWVLVPGRGPTWLRTGELATSDFRAPDPWYQLIGSTLVRRLSPNNRKIGLKDVESVTDLINPDMLAAMGHELAAVHVGVTDRRRAIAADLAKRKRRWMRAATLAAAEFVTREQEAWKRGTR
ncbi:MAG: DUF2252 family protein [Xanthobacteraceae bacterium]